MYGQQFFFMQLAKNQAALAAAKARFAQQQKENEEIAERTKRQRLGLPEPRPVYQEASCISVWPETDQTCLFVVYLHHAAKVM